MVLTSTQEACFAFLELAWLDALLSSQILGLYPLSQGTCLHDLPTPPHTQGSMGPCGLPLFRLNVPLETQMRLGEPICEPWERK